MDFTIRPSTAAAVTPTAMKMPSSKEAPLGFIPRKTCTKTNHTTGMREAPPAITIWLHSMAWVGSNLNINDAPDQIIIDTK